MEGVRDETGSVFSSQCLFEVNCHVVKSLVLRTKGLKCIWLSSHDNIHQLTTSNRNITHQ